MPGFTSVMAEIRDLVAEFAAEGRVVNDDGLGPSDIVRYRYLGQLVEYTGRPTVNFATSFDSPLGVLRHPMDMQLLMAANLGLQGEDVDVVLTTPGGDANMARAFVQYLRDRFPGCIRCLVPLAAMSAGTMIAMGFDEVVMGKQSRLGPIDPQLFLPINGIPVAAAALLRDFERACAVSSDVELAAWSTIISRYPIGILDLCRQATAAAKAIVIEQLSGSKLLDVGDDDRPAAAERVADYLADDNVHLSHGRGLRIQDLVDIGVRVTPMEADQQLQERLLSLHHATELSMQLANAFKLAEGSAGGRLMVSQTAPA